MTAARIDKTRVLAALRERLERDLAVATEAQRQTQSGATHEEAKPENDKDTRALESSYLARGQAQRVLELTQAVASASALVLREFGPETPIGASALVALDDGSATAHYFLSPVGGGMTFDVDGVAVRVLTSASPLGRALVGQTEGADIEVQTPQGLRQYSIAAVD
jgi:GreA/GreB family transcription elongation factor